MAPRGDIRMHRTGPDREQLISLIDRSNPTILEVGANIGAESRRFAEWFPYAQVFAFEPDPRPLRTFHAQPPHPRIHMEQLALGRHEGKATFFQSGGVPPATPLDVIAEHHSEGWHQSGSLREPKDHLQQFPWVKFDSTIEVEVMTLDRWAEEKKIKLIDFIWADVQGAEADLIAGGATMLRQTRYFYTEFSATELYEGAMNADQIGALLPDFEIVEIFQHDVLFRNARMPCPWGSSGETGEPSRGLGSWLRRRTRRS